MTLEERDIRLKRLEDLLEHARDDQNSVAIQLCEIWLDGLWEVSDDSFAEFVESEYEMSESDAFIVMKATASTGQFPEDIVEKINAEFERLNP